jgi:hypothetical protein
MRVFISYSSKDGIQYAKKLHEVLSKRGHDAYLIDHSVCVTQSTWDEIGKEILDRERIIFVITESSQESPGQKQEYDLAVAQYKKSMALAKENSWKIVETRFPFLTIPKGVTFNQENLEAISEDVSTQLVRLQNQEARVEETRVEPKQMKFEKLDDNGLEESEVRKCLESLLSSYQNQTIIPEVFNLREAENTAKDFVNIGLNLRLPREWFLPYEQTNVVYANGFLFQQLGRDIAFAERKYLVQSVLKAPNLTTLEVEPEKPDSLLAKIREAISIIEKTGHETRVIFPSISHYLTMYKFGKLAQIEYDKSTPKPTLPVSLNIDKCKLKIIDPFGQVPQDTILFAEDAITWNVKVSKQGVLYADLGNDRLYPKKYVNALALTLVKCEVRSKSVAILKDKATKD